MVSEGIHKDLSYEEYDSIDAFSNSRAKLLEESPEILKYQMDHAFERKESKALRVGRAVHCAVFEPHKFSKEFVESPKFSRRKEDVAAKEKFNLEHEDKTVLAPEEMAEANGMARSVLATQTGTTLISEADKEVTIVWKDKGTGILCKARADAWNRKMSILMDLKTTSDILHDTSLERLIYFRRYYRQLAWYMQGLEALGERVDLCVLIFVYKAIPYPVRFCAVAERALRLGKQEMMALLSQYAECMRQNKWVGYGDEITGIDIPSFIKTEGEPVYNLENGEMYGEDNRTESAT